MTHMTTEELLDGIRGELMVIQSHAGRVAMSLESIADSLPIPFVPVEAPEAAAWSSYRREQQFRKALEIVRAILDNVAPNGPNATPHTDASRRLFDVEALLSAELGQPVWEGRSSTDEDDAAQLRAERAREGRS